MIEWFKKPVEGFTYRNFHLVLDVTFTICFAFAVLA
jgi:hypothetical protein